MKIYFPLIDYWHFTVIRPQRILVCEGLCNYYCYHCNRGNYGNLQYQASTLANKSETRTVPVKLLCNEEQNFVRKIVTDLEILLL